MKGNNFNWFSLKLVMFNQLDLTWFLSYSLVVVSHHAPESIKVDFLIEFIDIVLIINGKPSPIIYCPGSLINPLVLYFSKNCHSIRRKLRLRRLWSIVNNYCRFGLLISEIDLRYFIGFLNVCFCYPWWPILWSFVDETRCIGCDTFSTIFFYFWLFFQERKYLNTVSYIL